MFNNRLKSKVADLEARVAQLEAQMKCSATKAELAEVKGPERVMADEAPGPDWKLVLRLPALGDGPGVKVWEKSATESSAG